MTAENLAGRGPCYLKTVGITDAQEKDLLNAYLNMSPAQTLRWIETEQLPSKFNVEISGTEPYIIGGHTAAGYWVNVDRQTTLKNLFAIGDVAGGLTQNYRFNERQLDLAAKNIQRLEILSEKLHAAGNSVGWFCSEFGLSESRRKI